MNKIKKILFRLRKHKLYNELIVDLHFLIDYLYTHDTPNYQELNLFYDYWKNFSDKYIQTPENSLLYNILDILNKKECLILQAYMITLINKWCKVITNHDNELTKIITELSKIQIQRESKIKTHNYALNMLNLQKCVTTSFQKLMEIFEKYTAIKE